MFKHSETFLAHQHEMDLEHLLRVQCLCNYMEDAAGQHADLLGVGLARLAEDDLAWVLAKMRLLLFRRPASGEVVRVDTWPVSAERVQFRRDFIIYDAREQVLATAVTQWVVMGLASRRLERFPPYITALEPKSPPPLAQERGDIRIPVVEDAYATDGPVFPVRLADIDQNRHVNNGRYIDFTLESAERAEQSGALTQLDIMFRAEGRYGDVIGSRFMPEEGAPGSCIHSLFRLPDGQELARVRAVFA